MSTIEHTIEVSSTPEQTYEALTTERGLTRWWAKDADIGAAEVGATHALRFVKGDNTVTMSFEITGLDTGQRVEWKCTDNGNPVWVGTTLRWTIEAAGAGSRVVFTHSGFVEDQSPPYTMTVDGWKHFVGSLRAHLSGEPGQPW